MDLSRMTNLEVQNEALGHGGNVGVHGAIMELSRRLEKAESLARVYWTECEAWRAWHIHESGGFNDGFWCCSSESAAENINANPTIFKARAATDAARAATKEADHE